MSSVQPPAPDARKSIGKVFRVAAKRRFQVWGLATTAAVAPNIGEIVAALHESKFSSSPITGTLASVFLITSVGFYDAWLLRKHIKTDYVSRNATLVFFIANMLSALYLLFLSNFYPKGAEGFSPNIRVAFLVWGALSLSLIAEAWIAIERVRWPSESE